MPDTNPRETITHVLCDVLERFAFLFPMPADGDEPAPAPDRGVETTISFSGPHTGRLSMVLPQELCTEVAANVLGTEPDDERARERRHDAAKEMLNIICGQFLTEHYGEDMVFDLSPPDAENISNERWTHLQDCPDTSAFSMMEGSLLFRLDLGEEG